MQNIPQIFYHQKAKERVQHFTAEITSGWGGEKGEKLKNKSSRY